MRILIVDDDYVSRTKLKALLGAYGDCDAVPDGKIALEMFDISCEEGVPYDLVTMDIDMPGMRGQDVVAEILSREQPANVKILMVTCKKEIKEIAASFRNGCDWCLNKPVTPEKLSNALEKIGIDNA